MIKELKWLVCAAAVAVIAACGGGGGSAGTSPIGPGTGTDTGGSAGASVLTLRLDAASIDNSGSKTVTATATAATPAGQAASGVPVAFSVDKGATFTQSGAVTGTTGQVTAVISIGSSAANRVVTVTASSGSLSTTAAFAITGAVLTGTAVPAVVTPGSTGNRVDFRLVDANGAAMINQDIKVDAGSVGTVTGTTGANGEYSYSYTAPTLAGTLSITASAGGVTNTQTITVSGSTTVPSAMGPINSASVSANPSVVPVNTTSTSNRTEIRALFVGPNNAAIKNVRVRFDLAGDVNSVGGTFSTADNVVYSDVNGVATTAYIPGTRASPTNGVTVRACYSATDFASCSSPGVLTTTATVTVVSEPLSVTIGSNNVVIIPTANLTYRRQYVVLVVDSSGRAKANVDIVPSIDLPYYFRGRYVVSNSYFPGYLNNMGQPVPAFMPLPGCPNEDINRNGILEAGEDYNGSKSIEPRKSDATITILGNGKTDENGSAIVQVEYPQNVASWLQVKILVSATGVSGTEGRATWTEILPIPANSLVPTATPPFVYSPYGTSIRDQNDNLPSDAGYDIAGACSRSVTDSGR